MFFIDLNIWNFRQKNNRVSLCQTIDKLWWCHPERKWRISSLL